MDNGVRKGGFTPAPSLFSLPTYHTVVTTEMMSELRPTGPLPIEENWSKKNWCQTCDPAICPKAVKFVMPDPFVGSQHCRPDPMLFLYLRRSSRLPPQCTSLPVLTKSYMLSKLYECLHRFLIYSPTPSYFEHRLSLQKGL
jgi:hypothetical protein